MCIKKYWLIIIALFSLTAAAQVDALEKLQSNPAYEVKLHIDSTLEIYNKHKNYRYLRTIKQQPEYDNTAEVNLVIRLDTVNFAAYENLYREWGYIPAANPFGKYTAIDADKNGKNELYVWYLYPVSPVGYTAVRIYEQETDSIFNQVYEFPTDSLNFVFDVGDITEDGLLDIISRDNNNKMHFFKQQTDTSYINTPNFIYNPFPPVYQPNNVTFYDIDGDGNLDIIYFLFAGDGDSAWAYSNHVAKYNPEINNYELIYYHRPLPDFYTNGISIGDFDQDGKGNFATGSIYGKFYIYEHVDGTEYQVEFTKELETSNAYLTTFTDDMDGNGKPEVWIGGDIGGVTRLFAFEASSPGVYEQIYRIDILGLGSLTDGKMRYVDLDGSGKKDLFLHNANLAFGFKYDGNGNYYMDFVIKAPEFDSTYIEQELWAIDVADLDGNGIPELIPQYSLSKGPVETWEYRSVFLKRDKVLSVDIEEPVYQASFNLYQNYPNPFNPETRIKFVLPVTSEVRINVYNILGKEIKELLNETRLSGEYEITWNGEDNFGNKVPSGVYFITMLSNPDLSEKSGISRLGGQVQKTIKSLLIK
jgi:hypothetical protein